MIERYYTSGITLKTLVSGRSTGGEYTRSYSSGTAIRGRIRKLNGNEMVIGDKQNFISDHRLYCSPSVNVGEGDLIVFNSKEFEVTSVNDVMNMSRHLQVELKIR